MNQNRGNGDFGSGYGERQFESEARGRETMPRRQRFSGSTSSNSKPPVQDFSTSQDGSKIVMFTPSTYEDVQYLIDYLKRREQVIVNFSGIAPESIQRILDFMSGAVYALSGSTQRITKNIYLFAPQGVSIMVPPSLRK